MDQDTIEESPAQSKLMSADLVSLVAAVLFGAAALIVLAGESLADVDPVLLAGIALIAIGVARFVAVPLRASARRRALAPEQGEDPEPQSGQDQDQTSEA